MDTRILLDKVLLDTTPERETIVTLLYSSDEPAHPVWGGGVKQRTFPASIPTGELMPQILGETGAAYIHWPDAPPAVASWFKHQPGSLAFTDWIRFDRTGPADAGTVALARQHFNKYGQQQGQNKVVVSVAPDVPRLGITAPEPTPEQQAQRLAIRHVTFERHDGAAPWVATHITPLPAATGAPAAAAPGAAEAPPLS
jgi:hypothetical protein